MNQVALLLCLACLGLARSSTQAAPSTGELYVTIYETIVHADSLRERGQGRPALENYLFAQAELKKLQAASQNWEPKLVDFRLKYLAGRIAPLAVQFPGTQPAKSAVPASKQQPPRNKQQPPPPRPKLIAEAQCRSSLV